MPKESLRLGEGECGISSLDDDDEAERLKGGRVRVAATVVELKSKRRVRRSQRERERLINKVMNKR